METVTLKIDGQTVTVPKGTNVLEAARTIGVDISYFCYHPGLSSPAVCRQCLVEVAGQPKLAPSCYTPVAENMDVKTGTDKVLLARQQMLEFTLVNHPVDCPICDKAGECTLQKLYFDWDSKPSRVDVLKIGKAKVVDIGPHIVLDQERCILCTRCIRVCDEVAHDHQLTMASRGDREILTTAPGERLDNPYSINTVDVCPVGALTAKDFRFTMRAWELKMVPSICTGCATGCNDEIHFAAEKIWRLIPRHNPEVNQYWMCDEGRFTYKEVHEGRVGSALIAGLPTSGNRAIEEIVRRLKACAPADVGVVFGAQASNEDAFALAALCDAAGFEQRFLGGRPLRPERADNILRHADCNPNTNGVKALAGKIHSSEALSKALADGKIKALLVMGEDLNLPETALSKLETLMVMACHENEWVRRAQVVLPAASWAEVYATMTNAKGKLQKLNAALSPPGDARAHWEWVTRLAAALDVRLPWTDSRAVFRDMVEKTEAFKGLTWSRNAVPVQLRFAGSRG